MGALINQVKDLQNNNFKILKKETEKISEYGEISHAWGSV